MADNTIKLNKGFFVGEGDIVNCLFAEVQHKQEHYQQESAFLVVIDGVVSIAKTYRNNVFSKKGDAVAKLASRNVKSINFYKKQIESYQKSLNLLEK